LAFNIKILLDSKENLNNEKFHQQIIIDFAKKNKIIIGDKLKNISVNEKFLWLLDRFSRDEIKILDQSDYVSDDEYLRGIEGIIQTIQAARNESIEQSLSLEELDW
jgi:hypothetical protein